MKRIAALLVAMLGCGGGEDGHGGKGFAPLTGARDAAAPRAIAIDATVAHDAATPSISIVADPDVDLSALAPYRDALAACLVQHRTPRAEVVLNVLAKGVVLVTTDSNPAETCIGDALKGLVVPRGGRFTITSPDVRTGPIRIVNVCATWAKPCGPTTEALDSVAKSWLPDTVRVEQVLIDVDDAGAAAWRTAHAAHVSVTGASDPRAAGVDNVPTTSIYDLDGSLVQTMVGTLSEDELRHAIGPMLPPL